MKSIIIIVAFAILGLIISQPSTKLVTGISPATGIVGNAALTFTVKTTGWTVGDKIILTTASTPGTNDPLYIVPAVPLSSPISVTFNFYLQVLIMFGSKGNMAK